jgi:hypothetical protein
MLPSRRTLLGAMSLLPLAVGCAGLTQSSPGRLDLATAAGRLSAYRRMRGSLDERVVIGYVTGRYYGVVDTDPVPLFGVAAATFTRYRTLPDGSVLLVSCEQAYYTDLETGVLLDEWTNPLHGERVKVPVVRTDGQKLTLSDRLVFSGAPIPGVSAEHFVLPPERQGSDVVFVEQVRFAAAVPGQPKPFRYSEAVSARASATELADTDAPHVRCTTAFTNFSSWRPWMRMGDRPGVLVAHGTGRYGAVLDELPKVWLEATKNNRPELLADPGSPLEAAWKS